MNEKSTDFIKSMQTVSDQLSQLPEPDAESCSQSEQLQQRIREQIVASDGQISFAQFMHMALYEPGLGYYASSQRKLGAEGDFVTAPEISPLFGRCLAHFCKSVLVKMENASILEFGAGSGKMAVDILLELESQHALPAHYFILEVSADLQQRQQQTLQTRAPHLLGYVTWLQQLPEKGFSGVVLANELLDAMPVHRFYKNDQQLQQWYIGWSDQQQAFVSLTGQPEPEVLKQLEHVQAYLGMDFAPGYESEISLAHAAWLTSLNEMLDQAVVLLIDYGYGRDEYYHAERSMGTLMCHYHHRAHPDPFKYIGLQDITAFVDFTTVAEAAVSRQMALLGYGTQCGFLLENGLDQMAPDEHASDQELLLFSQQVKTLTLPSEMGERFKVMALGKNFDAPVKGFQLQDLRGWL